VAQAARAGRPLRIRWATAAAAASSPAPRDLQRFASGGRHDQLADFVNLGEPYRDDNENGQYDLGEYFLDFNQNGKWDAGDGTFKGITCTGTTAGSTCSTKTLAIGASHLIIMSTSGAKITLLSPASPVTITHGTGSSIQFNVQDLNGNPIAAGSTIVVTAAQRDPGTSTSR
jgi:hypothetical protein